MKLKKLIVSSFRGLQGENNVIEFEDSNIIFLLGKNNVGKSTFLYAYKFLVDSGQKAGIDDFYKHDATNSIQIEAWFQKEDDDDENSDFSQYPDWIDNWVGDDGYVKIRKIWKEQGKQGEKETWSSGGEWIKGGFGGMDTLLQKYSPTPILIEAVETEESLEKKVNDLINKDFLKKIQETHREQYNDIKSKIYELQKGITNSETVGNYNDQLNECFTKVFSDLTLEIKPKGEDEINILKAFEKNHSISVKSEMNSHSTNFTQHGHGVIRQILFNFLKFYGSKNQSSSYIVLFEEPEIFLHPKAAFRLRESLYELVGMTNFQVMCASHSPLMIDISKSHSSLVRVTKTNSISTTYQVGKDIFQASDEKKQFVKMIVKFNPHICEAFFANKVLLVEGDTEMIVYRKLLEYFSPNEDIFVLNTGSKNNIPFLQEILIHFCIEHYVIHDVDEKLDKNGNANSARTLNSIIWNNVMKANQEKEGLSRRYVHNTNFESAHNYEFNTRKGKPLSAYEFIENNIQSALECKKFLEDIIGQKNILHNNEYVNGLVD